ncbi:hypothetical protein V8B97DRAFT_2026258 [Scleroderma yunnanense]
MEEVLKDSQEVAEHFRISYTHNCIMQKGSMLILPIVPKKYKEVILEDSIVFCCPGSTGCNGKWMFHPYWGFTTQNENGQKVPVLPANPHIQTHYGMFSHSEVNDDPLTIIYLYLAGMDPYGSPPYLIYESFCDLFLDHCDHGGHESPVADEVTKFFETILCGGIAPFLNGGILVLLTCSWVIKFEDSFASLQTALVQFPIYSELGAHTDIMYFSFNCSSSPPIMSMMCDKYVWWNANMWPYGHNIPFCCPTCTSEGEAWTLQCSNPDCSLNADKVSRKKPANLTFVMPSNKRTNGWIHFRVVDVKTTLE